MPGFFDRLGNGFLGQGNRMEILLGSLLGIVILVSVVLTINGLLRENSDTSDEVAKRFYLCDKCGHAFEHEPPAEGDDPMVAMQHPEALYLDCPSCGEKQSCRPAIKCPNPDCQRIFAEAPISPTSPKQECPYCHTDVLEWARTHVAGVSTAPRPVEPNQPPSNP